jgi:hypothetical protein
MQVFQNPKKKIRNPRHFRSQAFRTRNVNLYFVREIYLRDCVRFSEHTATVFINTIRLKFLLEMHYGF